jgi:two-component system, chemotaxis family, protein-glutamate methylesterase/glutaminase
MNAAAARAIVVGASAGALDALSAILPRLPASFGLPVIVVVHVPPDKQSLLAELFRAKCSVNVKEAEDKEPIMPGTIYFAPPDYHVLVETNGILSLSSEEPAMFSRPSIDVLFESAADSYGSGLIAIVLTGANSDGALGAKAVMDAGGRTIVQDPEEAFAAAMPLAAIAMNPGATIMPVANIAAFLLEGALT